MNFKTIFNELIHKTLGWTWTKNQIQEQNTVQTRHLIYQLGIELVGSQILGPKIQWQSPEKWLLKDVKENRSRNLGPETRANKNSGIRNQKQLHMARP